MNGFLSNHYDLAICSSINAKIKKEANTYGGQLERLLGRADIYLKFLSSIFCLTPC